ncbi:MAG: hypothetical protein AB7J46_07205 [Candidatus Altimarinota bacterium]
MKGLGNVLHYKESKKGVRLELVPDVTSEHSKSLSPIHTVCAATTRLTFLPIENQNHPAMSCQFPRGRQTLLRKGNPLTPTQSLKSYPLMRIRKTKKEVLHEAKHNESNGDPWTERIRMANYKSALETLAT